MIRRQRWKFKPGKERKLGPDEYVREKDTRTRVYDDGDFHLYSSALETGNGIHAPVIDIDHDIAVVESSTKGHYHLYINVPMTWRQYKRLLRAMVKCGLVEQGYYNVSRERKETFVRKPGHWKEDVGYERRRELKHLEMMHELIEIQANL